jgi:multidrug efflux pump subunit AcrA (membrane-fusion protein)
MVWVLENAIPVRRFVRIGQLRGDQVTIISGLAAGEKLIAPDDIIFKYSN